MTGSVVLEGLFRALQRHLHLRLMIDENVTYGTTSAENKANLQGQHDFGASLRGGDGLCLHVVNTGFYIRKEV